MEFSAKEKVVADDSEEEEEEEEEEEGERDGAGQLPTMLRAVEDFQGFCSGRSWYKHLRNGGGEFAVFVTWGKQGRWAMTHRHQLHWWFEQVHDDQGRADVAAFVADRSPETAHTLGFLRFDHHISNGQKAEHDEQLLAFLQFTREKGREAAAKRGRG